MPTSRWSSRALVVFVAAFLFVAFILAVSALRGTASAAPPSSPAAWRQITTGSGCWTVLSSPNYYSGTTEMRNSLTAVDAANPNMAWAIGYAFSDSELGTDNIANDHLHQPKPSKQPASPIVAQLFQWNGSQWSIVYTQTQTGLGGDLDIIDETHAWAVFDNTALRWNGVVWSVNHTFDNVSLSAIDSISDQDVWAVGSTTLEPSSPFTAHWNGSSWTIIQAGLRPDAALNDVQVVSANNAWAVGYFYYGPVSDLLTLVLHWNGTTWEQVPSPNPSLDVNSLHAISVVNPSDIWAVGMSVITQTETSLVEHWDGTDWQVVGVPGIGLGNYLNGVEAVASNDAWAVGTYRDSGGRWRGLTYRWNGSEWEIVPTPGQSIGEASRLIGMAPDHAGGYWAVGDYQVGFMPERTLILHFDPGCIPTPTPVPPTPQPPPCPGERFTDVCPTDYFYTAALALASDGILSGYNTAPPCNNSLWVPCYRPYSSITRGQIAKVASLAAGFNEPVSGQTFRDVPPGSNFYEYIERMASRGIMGGYFGEPRCSQDPPPNQLPCFYPNRINTRGQLSKVVARTFNFGEPVSGQTFEDVAPGSTFYEYIERIAGRGIISGYACGAPNEPCILPTNRPYFRPNNNVTRGQAAKIIQLARTQPTPTPTATRTATPVPTNTRLPTQTPGGATATFEPSDTVTSTATPSQTPAATSTACPIQFTDVTEGSTFYPFIRCLACRGIVSGYPDGTFKPNNLVSRGQLSKIVSNAAGFFDPQSGQTFEDVPPGSTFFDYVGRLASRGHVGGYNCGGPGEPCVPPNNLPYFRPNNTATRGQIAKIVCLADNCTGSVSAHGLVINEVFDSQAAGNDYFELYNASAVAIDLSSYVIYNRDGFTPLSRLTNPRIEAGQFRAIGPTQLLTPTIGGPTGLARTDFLALVNTSPSDTTVDVVNWGNVPNINWPYYDRFAPYFFTAGTQPFLAEDAFRDIQRWPDGLDTNQGGDWHQISNSPGIASCGDPYEDDNSFNSALNQNPNTTNLHRICPAGDNDFIAINMSASFTYTLQALTVGSQVDTALRLFDANVSIVAEDDPSSSRDSTIVFHPPHTGVYTLQVYDHNYGGSSGQGYLYNLRIIIQGSGLPQTFEDVSPGSTFYDYIERLAARDVVSGYPCGGGGEPCVPPENRPYFRPNNNATRGQTSKIVGSTFFHGCYTPAR